MFAKLFSTFNSQAKSITSAAIIIGVASFASKILGVLRDRVLAGEFGAERTLDIYYASFRIPDFIFNVLVLGTLSAGFIPIFTQYLKKDMAEAWKLVNTLLSVMSIALVIVCGFFIFFTPYLMKIITPGFSPDELRLTIGITRIMFLSPILLGISGIVGGILQSFKRFFVYSLAPIMYNIGIIIGALFLSPAWGIYGLAFGVVLGAFMHLVIQLPTAYIIGFKPQWHFDLGHEGMRYIFRIMLARALSLAVVQFNFLFITIIGSTLSAGSITIFNLANNLQSVPLSLFGVSFAIAAFPTLSELAEKKNKFIESFSLTLRQILFFIIPSSALLIVLRAQIVRVALGTGRFDWQDTILTMHTLALFSLSLFAQSLIQLLTRAFHAFKDSVTPFFVNLISTICNIALSFLFIYLAPRMNLLGAEVLALAFAYSISTVINLLILWIILKIKLGDLDESNILFSTIKISFAALMMVLTIQGTKYVVGNLFGTTTFLDVASQGIISAGLGLAIYFILCIIVKSPEANLFFTSIQKRLLRKYTPTESVEQ